MTAVAKLLPCPFCGKSVATLSNTDELSGRPDISFMHTVVCNAHAGGCGSTVGYESDQDDAISTWNRRAALSPAELGGVGGLPPLPTPALRPHWADTTDYYSAAQMLNFARAAVLSTPRAAEAVTEEMVERAVNAYLGSEFPALSVRRDRIRAALTAALNGCAS